MEQDKLNLQVSAQNGVTRETLEAAIPRLRDLLDEGSYSSVNVDVSSGGFEQHQFSQNENIKEFDQASESELAELSTQQASAQTASKIGLVDTFA
jgi:flagellar hook-length control protein FliK